MNGFDAAYLGALPVVAPAIAWKRWRHGKYRESLPGMLGKRLPDRPLAAPKSHRVWMHSVSVGETVAAGAVYRELRRRTDWEFVCTTTTETGQAQARRTMQDAEHFAYAPADFSWTVRAHLDAYRPTVYAFFETEIWPNTLRETAARGIPVFLVNGKLSERSARRYAQASFLFRPILAGVRRFFMQTTQDAERLERVLGEASRIEVAGNVKFDALPDPLSPEQRAAFRASWGVGDGDVVALAGSTHPGEEEIVWRAFKAARERCPALRLVLAPRHPERFGEVAKFLADAGAGVHRASEGDAPAGGADVVVLDKMGVLGRAFGACEIALLAGSWKPIGGHNLLEPAVHGVPVLRGPHMHSQPDIVRVLGPDQGAPEVREDNLADTIARLAADADLRRDLGAKAQKAASSAKGAARLTVERMMTQVAP